MRQELVLTVIGADRPGLVELISRTVVASEGNWEASRMARMAGRFAGILRVSVPEGRAAALATALAALEGQGLRVIVESSGPVPPPADHRLLRLDLTGNDRPGVIREMSSVLVEHGINVEELTTETVSAAMAGNMLLKVSALLRTPPSVQLDHLRRGLEARIEGFLVDLVPMTREPDQT